MSPLLLFLYGVGFLLVCVLAPQLSRLLCHAWKLEKPNFQKQRIPAAVGMTFLVVCGLVYGILPVSGATLGFVHAPAFLLVSVGFGILGLYDDAYGSRATGGFRGHLSALMKGKPTTGAVKLLGGGILALLAAFLVYRTDWVNLLLGATLIALGANSLNLLDTRPGRAQFGFTLLFVLPVTIATFLVLREARFTAMTPLPDDLLFNTPPGVLLGPAVIAAGLEWWPDARGKAMMGDTGSNLLGAVGGLAAAIALPLAGRLELLLVLLFLNIAAEKISFNAVIEQNRFLRAIDRALGAR